MSTTPNLFAFVNELAGDHNNLVSHSREVLRHLHRNDDRIVLYLPFVYTSATIDVHSSLPMELQSLHQTAVIEIHSPAARNALSGKMMAEMADAVSILEDSEVSTKLNAVVLKGTDGWFCAGADLKIAKHDMTLPEAGAAMGKLMTDTLTRLRRLPLVSVACVEGGAYGGGAELAAACDFRIVETSAVIQFVQAHMGVSPAWSGGVWLYKLVGRAQALRLLCTVEKVSAQQALKLKLADDTFDATIWGASTAICTFVAPFDAIPSGTVSLSLCG